MASRSWRTATLALAMIALSVPAVLADDDSSAGPQAGQAPRSPSVVFYLMDTCRRDRMTYEGYGRETTPFLDWLAERSVVFEACYSQAPWTKPSMVSILTSQYPSKFGIFKMDHRLPAEALTWPEVLQASGMYTAGFSANIVMGNTLSNFAQGFDQFAESTVVNNGDPIRFASGSAKMINERASAWLDATEHWPMLLYMHSVDPHEEYEPEPEYLRQLADPERHMQFRDEWQQLLKSRPPLPGLYVTQDNFDRTEIDSASFIEHASNLYDADILANDDQLKRLWDKLQQDGWGDDMILVFTSDHGEEFFDHGGTSHGYSLYDEMIRVPLMIYAPGLLPAGKRITTPVRSLDIYPTLCDLLGLSVPEGLQGESLLPLIAQEGASLAAEQARLVFSEHREDPLLRRIGQGSGVIVSLRSGRWKFIVNEVGSQLLERPDVELYDLVEDPRELENVAALHPEVVQRLGREVEGFLADRQQPVSPTDMAEMDPEVLEQLRALGYVGEEQVDQDIWEALSSKDMARIRRCLEGGADPNKLDVVSGASPLSIVALVGNVEIARLLIAAGGDVNVRSGDGGTPLHGAAFFGRIEMVEFLLEQGADREATSTLGDTALASTRAPWEITEFVAAMLDMELDREAVEAGRIRCAELLRQ